MGVDVLTTKAKERVFDSNTGRKISLLNWQGNNAQIARDSLEWHSIPWFSLGAAGWTSFDTGDGSMTDYDWFTPGQRHWSDRSKSPDTRLNYANQYDINIKGWLLTAPNYDLGLVGSYQQTRYSWKAIGGHYNYNNGTNIGSFNPDIATVSYQQKFSLPYIGFTGRYRYQNVEFTGLFEYSHWVTGEVTDQHYLRDTTFFSQRHNQEYYSVENRLGYYLTPSAKICLQAGWARFPNKTGDWAVYNRQPDGVSGIAANSSGLANTSWTAGTGLECHF